MPRGKRDGATAVSIRVLSIAICFDTRLRDVQVIQCFNNYAPFSIATVCCLMYFWSAMVEDFNSQGPGLLRKVHANIHLRKKKGFSDMTPDWLVSV